MEINQITPSFEKTFAKTQENPSWEKFFEQFPDITKEEKSACIEQFMQFMSLQMQHMARRMIEMYKHMREV